MRPDVGTYARRKGLPLLLVSSLMLVALAAVPVAAEVEAGSGRLAGDDSDIDQTSNGTCFEATRSVYDLQGDGDYHGWQADGSQVVYSAQIDDSEQLHADGPIQVEVQNTETYYHGQNGTHGTDDPGCTDATAGDPVPAEFRILAEGNIHDGDGNPCVGHGEFARDGADLTAEWTLDADCTVEGNDAGTPGSGVAPEGSRHTHTGTHGPCFNPPCLDNIEIDYIQFLADQDPGTIAGMVIDADSGEAIDGAIVTADGESTTTDGDGAYEIADLDPGGYDVTAEADGYEPATQTGVMVEENATTTADFALEVADPQTRTDCMDDGWMDFGFENQGRCIRFVETGKDSRS